jgi:hypothetical protein
MVITCGACSAGGADPGFDESQNANAGAGAVLPGAGGAPSFGGAPGGGAPPGAAGASFFASGGGPSIPFAGYDPNVVFDWPQATQTGSCKAGHYHGSFTGIYSPSIAFAPGVPIPVAGDIDITLDESADGEFFSVSNGKISGLADLLFPFQADVKGTLNCTTGKFENGSLENGTYIVGVIPYNFSGPLPADYDKLTQSFTNGKWTVGEPAWSTNPPPVYGGSGEWNAAWTP